MSGRGIWTAPAVADIDVDGFPEIVTSVRDGAIDGSSSAWYVLDVDGKVVGQYPGTGMPREAADYDLDFGELMDHRLRARRALERLSK